MKSDTPKVLVVNTSDSSGGAARAAYRIQNAVNKLGGNSFMFVKNKGLDDDSVRSLSEFIPQHKLYRAVDWLVTKFKNKVQQYRWSKYPNKEDVFLSDLRSVSIHGAFRKIDFDILHLHWINLRFLNLKELTKIKQPIIWTLHDCWAFTGICHYFYDCDKYQTHCGTCPFLHSGKEKDLSYKVWKKKQKYYKHLNLHIVTPSKWLGEAAKQSALFSKFPVTVIPNPINTELFSPSDKEEACAILNIDSNKTYILYGAMNAVKDKNKGFAELLKALKTFTTNYDSSNINMLVLGASEPIQEFDISIPIQYLGVITEDNKMVAAYRAASLMIVPSLSENLSNAIMESLSCATPVLAFNIGGNSDMIDHQNNGYLAKEKDSHDLAHGINWCLENNKSGILSTNARKKVLENFTEEIVGKRYRGVYERVMKE
ncbi:glycosyltransferase family 4 protein [Paludibacter sp.]